MSTDAEQQPSTQPSADVNPGPKSRAADDSVRRERREGVSPSGVPDQPSKIDTLGFTPYVSAVAAFLLHGDTHPPLTLSIEGEWGSGKSSFMLQVETQLVAESAKTVWFNAWRHDRDEELWAAFALHFTNQLARTVPWWKRWYCHLKLAMRRFDWRRGWMEAVKFAVLVALLAFCTVAMVAYWRDLDPHVALLFDAIRTKLVGAAASTWDAMILKLLASLGGVGNLIIAAVLLRKLSAIVGNPIETHLSEYVRDPKYETRAAFIDAFHEDFGDLVKAYAEDRRVFVFIDDLDRCEIPKAAELMQALNLLISESAPVFYVLGLDRDKIAAGLAAKYEKLLPYLSSASRGDAAPVSGRAFGYAFLEKFIQLPFLVPQPTEPDVDKLLDSLGSQPRQSGSATAAATRTRIDDELLVSVSADTDAVRDVVKMVAPSFDYNPRRMKQFLNLFRLRALLASQTGLFGQPREGFAPLTFEQLGKLVAIQLRWPLLLEDIESNPNLLPQLDDVTAGTPSPTDDVRYWLADANLMELIGFPHARNANGGPDRSRYRLAGVDVERFLQVSPAVQAPRPEPQLGTSETSDARSREPEITVNDAQHQYTASFEAKPRRRRANG